MADVDMDEVVFEQTPETADTETRNNEDGSDLDQSDDEDLHAPASVNERKRAQRAIFERFLASEVVLNDLTPKVKQQKLLDADDEELSIHDLLSKQHVKLDNPREYQEELFGRAKQENTIAVLDTGSGKTLIAVMLLRWIIDQELEDRAQGKEPRISFFIVASVALAKQQHSVLESEVDHKVSIVTGADRADNWTKARWTKLFSDNKVIVVTGAVLHQALAYSYITMKQINLLIFDEAHHAKQNHPFARIIKDFYIEQTDEASRPRVFGMTASPVDAIADVGQAASELESLLHCRIATTNGMSVSKYNKKPIEQVMTYPPLPRQGFETSLLRSVKARFPQATMFESHFQKAADIARHLGRWCADMYLFDALSERRSKRLEQDADRRFYSSSAAAGDAKRADSPLSTLDGHAHPPQSKGVSQLDQKQALIRGVIAFVEKERSKYSVIGDGDLSPKVMKLKDFLDRQFERQSSHLCIVFVQARHTARLLNAVFTQKGTKHMRPGLLIGSGKAEMDEENFSNRTQTMAIAKFRKGLINCLFATSVAEEGLDVPGCNLVVRFDMYTTMIQYVQSRGRARQENSKFIHMLESGNSVQKETLQTVRYQELAMRKFCNSLPEDRKLIGNQDHLDAILAKETVLRSWVEPLTGAKLTYGNSLSILANFVSTIPTEANENLHPTYVVNNHGSKFICEVLLPGGSPISSAIGLPCTKRSLAKRSAAFEACKRLREGDHMNEHLRSTYEKRHHVLRNAQLAVDMHTSAQYTMRTKPAIWEKMRGTLPSELYMTIVDFSDGLNHPHRPLVMLTRTPMPQFPTFPIYLNDGRSSDVRSRSFAKAFEVSAEVMEKLTTFTFRIFSDMFSKAYEQDGKQLSYWLAPAAILDDPLPATDDEVPSHGVAPEIDWTLVDEVFANEAYKWTPETRPESMIGKFIVDPWDGTRKLFITGYRPDLKVTDPVPADAAKHKWMKNILEYSNSLFKLARARREGTWNMEQPVYEAKKILIRRNVLIAANAKEVNLRTRAVVCLEPLRISVLPPAVAESCLDWPAIIHRFESYMIALEGCDMVGVSCSPKMALAAMTKDSDNSGEHENTIKVNFQHGMGENYERLEFIGDTLLKTVSTISTFIHSPSDAEGDLHDTRMAMLCNKNLFQVACELGLYEYIRSMAFSRRMWYMEGLKLTAGPGMNKNEDTSVIKHALGQKTIADVCEALIGAAYLTHNKPGEKWDPSHWEAGVQAVTKLVKDDNHKMMKWTDYSAAYEKPQYQIGEVSASQLDLAEKVELEHPYHFTYPKLLRSAFIHPSQPFIYEKVPSYQRLEFLGDALLDQASIAYLFYRFPDKDPQWLTEHKMAMVSNRFLGAVCVNIGFYKHLRHNHSLLQHQIGKYVDELLEAKRTAGGRRDYWTTISEPPKCLPDIVEAYVGAMFLDSDFDYDVVQQFFEMHVKWYFEDMSVYDGFANNHPCTHLHNLLDTNFGCQDYRLFTKELDNFDSSEKKDVVVGVVIHNVVVTHSTGKSSRYARLRAAQQAIEALDGFVPDDFRKRFGCDCTSKEKGEAALEAAAVADCNV